MTSLDFGPTAHCFYAGTDKSTVSVRILEAGKPVDWLARDDFIRVRNTFNKWMRGTEDAEGPWMFGIERVFRAVINPDVSQWLNDRPHSLRMVWSAENDKKGLAIPRFDVMSLVFERSDDALLFKLTLFG